MPQLRGDHATNDPDCWCHPEVLRTCGECFDAKGKPDPDCWNCGGRGLIPVNAYDRTLAPSELWTIIHRERFYEHSDAA